ncbi:MAG: Holliday junction resolvase RuvX [Bacilli bacterium]
MRYLGLDLGSKTLGIAISDKNRIIARPLITLNYKGNKEKLLPKLSDIIKEKNIKKMVLGYPKNMNNTVGERAKEIILFKELLEANFNIEIILYDERLSTKEAENILINADLSRKKRKKIIDQMAAVIILQNYLNLKKGI